METLKKLFPEIPKDTLQIIFEQCNHNANDTALVLLGENVAVRSADSNRVSVSKRKPLLDYWYPERKSVKSDSIERTRTRTQSETATFAHSLSKKEARSPETVLVKSLPHQRSASHPGILGRSAFDVLEDHSPNENMSTSLLDKSPLHLATPESIYKETNGMCSLTLKVLPEELANDLYLKMIAESEGKGEYPKWNSNQWYIADRLVTSPHTTAFYRRRDQNHTSEHDEDLWYLGNKNHFSGHRYYIPEMEEACSYVMDVVNGMIKQRSRHPLEWDHHWVPNVAAANRYSGRDSSVGWHADMLTRLGPQTTIASLSLGTEREFRLRKVGRLRDTDEIRTLVMTLPHNSLVIMHAGCQEYYRHTAPSMRAIDTFNLGNRSFIDRINITYRFYRPDFDPEPCGDYPGTPKCYCQTECDLRPDLNGKVKKRWGTSKNGQEPLYFWMCSAGKRNYGKSCNYFKLLDFNQERRGQYYPLPRSLSFQPSAKYSENKLDSHMKKK